MRSKGQTIRGSIREKNESLCPWKTCYRLVLRARRGLHNPSHLKTYNLDVGALSKQVDIGTDRWVERVSPWCRALWAVRWLPWSRSVPHRFVHLPAQGSFHSAIAPATESRTCPWEPRSPAWLAHRSTYTEEWLSPALCTQAHTWNTERISAPGSIAPLLKGKTDVPQAPRPPGCNDRLN